MKNYIQPGEFLEFTAPAAVVSGVPVLVGAAFLIPAVSAASGERLNGLVEGVVELPKVSALAIGEFVVVYWDDTAKLVNLTSTGNKEIGYATAAAANPSPTVKVKLVPTLRATVAA